MNCLKEMQKELQKLNNESCLQTYALYPGIELSFLTLHAETFTLHHQSLDHILEINYCREGRAGWKLKNGNSIYLGSGDYVLNNMKCCASSVMSLPNSYYEGLLICIDLDQLSAAPPEILDGTQITGESLYQKFCKDGGFTSLTENEETLQIFSSFYNQPKHLAPAYWKLKVVELLLYLSKQPAFSQKQLNEYQAEQIQVIRKIHQQMIDHIDQRFTIEYLSKEYLMNPTTLKTLFKAVYGNSIAAHIKEHRMEAAAKMLLESNKNIAEIARSVGYDNQSKFTAAFKESYHVLPTEYRRQR